VLVVTDWNMPKMDGIEAAKRIHREIPDLPVILWTATDPKRARKAGFRGPVFEKTDHVGKLRDLIREYVNL